LFPLAILLLFRAIPSYRSSGAVSSDARQSDGGKSFEWHNKEAD
jgi:hypothetical protein